MYFIHVYMHKFIQIHVHLCTYIHIYIHTYILYTHIYIWIYILMINIFTYNKHLYFNINTNVHPCDCITISEIVLTPTERGDIWHITLPFCDAVGCGSVIEDAYINTLDLIFYCRALFRVPSLPKRLHLALYGALLRCRRALLTQQRRWHKHAWFDMFQGYLRMPQGAVSSAKMLPQTCLNWHMKRRFCDIVPPEACAVLGSSTMP